MGKRLISRKGVPDKETLEWRRAFLRIASALRPSEARDLVSGRDEIYLERGNHKVGKRSQHYDNVFVWNLPPVATCPGASDLCTTYCYNADPREDVFPIEKWLNNWRLSLYQPDLVERKIVESVRSAGGKSAFRIHSSGDFFSEEYVLLWERIISSLPDTDFWTYTRSWVKRSILRALERLRSLENVQVFASWDNTMPPPPQGWRRAIVITHEHEVRPSGIICPEQVGEVEDCAHCRYCIRRGGKGDVFFILY